MESNATERDEMVEMLVLADGSGSYYSIPRETVESYRVTEAQKASIEKVLGDDVAGYLQNFYMKEKMAAYHQADLLREADQERMARLARGTQTESEAVPDIREASPVGALFGMFISMVRPARTQTA